MTRDNKGRTISS